MSDKIYCGSGKEKVFDNGGSKINVSVCVSNIPKEKIFSYKGKSYVKLEVVKKREEDQYGKTHYVAIDEFEPKKDELHPNNIGKAVKDAGGEIIDKAGQMFLSDNDPNNSGVGPTNDSIPF